MTEREVRSCVGLWRSISQKDNTNGKEAHGLTSVFDGRLWAAHRL